MTALGVPSLSACSTDGLAEASVEYIRQARRLRHRHRGNPQRLHQSLRRLAAQSAEQPALPRIDRSASAVLTHEVEDAMDGPVLRYSERTRLLRRAEQLGIGRFDANLLIATVQHRHRGRAEAFIEAPIAEAPRGGRGPSWRAGNILAVALLVEAAAVVVGWWAIMGG